MLERLTVAEFTPLVGAEFRLITPDASSQAVRLQSALALGAAREPGVRDPFALHFLAASANVLPQAIYRLEHDTLGPLDIFLVPIGWDASGVTYEAIFT